MSMLSNILRGGDNGNMSWHCPGCGMRHSIRVGEGSGPRWVWNGNTERPTFTPSVLVTYPANPDAEEEFKEWRKERICHSFVVDGQMQFLGDCTHELVGQTVPIPPFELLPGEAL